jgi:uncharacterized membrane protein
MAIEPPATSNRPWSQVRAEAERARDAAHRPTVAAAGPYGHPLHPLLVTVPIGMFVATFAFDIASLTVEGRAFGRAATWLSALGIVTALVAAAAGVVDLLRIAKGTPARRTAVTHLILMDLVVVLFIVGFFVRRADETQYLDGTPMLAVVLSGVAVVLLLVGGWLGGKLVYGYGVRVSDEHDQLTGYLPADSGPPGPRGDS